MDRHHNASCCVTLSLRILFGAGWLGFAHRETLCDAYTICQESYYVDVSILLQVNEKGCMFLLSNTDRLRRSVLLLDLIVLRSFAFVVGLFYFI